MSSDVHNTLIKICGLTREADVLACVQAGANAIGFVMYPPSARYVSPERAGILAKLLPPEITPVLLFVNASLEDVQAACQAVPDALLQFHGDESPSE
ncbi:MAG: phosphoribosylanthranilate isomerase, partial [Burkholderiaceae bacterium]|nr:phosphoribosylanthranilate isomerase [Burkholderiaceae bacterium]